MLKYFIFLCLLTTTVVAQKLQLVSIQLLWQYQFQFAGYIMAKEKGFYADEGIDVQLREFEVGKLPVDEVKKGVLQVDFEKENGAYKLLVKDNGVGFDTTKQYYTSLGMMLIQRLVTKQLNGTIDISCDNGAKIIIRWGKNV